MSQKIDVAVTIDGRRITLEFPTEFYNAAIAFLSSSSGAQPGGAATGHSGLDAMRSRSEGDVVAEKKPSGHAETIAVLAYCLREAGTVEFNAEEMRRAYIRGSVRPPKAVAQALRDAKNRYEYIEPGTRSGTFRLSAHGERVVLFDLPRAN